MELRAKKSIGTTRPLHITVPSRSVTHRNLDTRKRWRANTIGIFVTLWIHAIILQTWVHGEHQHSTGPSAQAGLVGVGSLSLLMIDSPADKQAVNIKLVKGLRTDALAIEPAAEIPPPPTLANALEPTAQSEAVSPDRRMMFAICRNAYPDPTLLAYDVAHISLRKSEAPAGPIGESDINISDGDRSRALLAMRCLQAFGSLPPRAAAR